MDGLYLLWWVQEKQMSPALVAATMAAGDLLLMALEIPTGWFADRFGNRRSLILGSLVQVAGMICCWLADGMSGLFLACALVAIGDAFRSGADQALLYRSCVALGREGDFQKIEARSRAVQVIALAGLIVGGGAIVTTWGFAAGWAAETLLCTIGGVIAWAMAEPPAGASEDTEEESPALRTRIPWRIAAVVILPLAILDALAASGSFVLQTSGGSSPGQVTILVSLITLADAAGSALAMRLPAAGLRTQVCTRHSGSGRRSHCHHRARYAHSFDHRACFRDRPLASTACRGDPAYGNVTTCARVPLRPRARATWRCPHSSCCSRVACWLVATASARNEPGYSAKNSCASRY